MPATAVTRNITTGTTMNGFAHNATGRSALCDAARTINSQILWGATDEGLDFWRSIYARLSQASGNEPLNSAAQLNPRIVGSAHLFPIAEDATLAFATLVMTFPGVLSTEAIDRDNLNGVLVVLNTGHHAHGETLKRTITLAEGYAFVLKA